jgi:hypothetical protein
MTTFLVHDHAAATAVEPAKSGRGLLGRYDEGQVREVIEFRARTLLMLDGLSR